MSRGLQNNRPVEIRNMHWCPKTRKQIQKAKPQPRSVTQISKKSSLIPWQLLHHFDVKPKKRGDDQKCTHFLISVCVSYYFFCPCQNFKFMHWPSDNRLLKWRGVEVAVCLCLVPGACKWIVGLSEWWHHMCVLYKNTCCCTAFMFMSCLSPSVA